jgi:diguanylate cyclase (GGDEF)-like protein
MKARAAKRSGAASQMRGTLLAPHWRLLDEVQEQLIQCKYFSTMTPDILRMVLKTGELLEVPAGVKLVREGATDEDMFFLLDGSVAVQSGEKVILRLNAPGDVVGEFAVVSDQARSADVVTETKSRLVRVSTSFVRRWSANPKLVVEFYTVFSHIMAAKLRDTSRRARLYEDAVLEARDLASSHTRLESEIEDKLNQITLYSRVIESSQAAVLITDAEGAIVSLNPAATELLRHLGIRLGAKASKIMQLVAEFDLGSYAQQDFGAAWQGEWIKDDPDSPTVLQVTVTPIFGQDDAPLRVAFQMSDISVQKEQERALAAKNEEIRNALLDLEATYQELQRSDLMKTETLNAISNELGTPIRKIINHSAKILQAKVELSPEELQLQLEAIHEQTEFLRIVTENINYLIDLQTDLQKVGTAPLDLREVAHTVSGELEAWAKRKGIKFALELPDEPLTLVGNQDQFKTVLGLLAEQALLVSKARSVVTMRGRALEASQQVQIEIAYQGPSFKTLSASDSVAKGRMGLIIGLPLARKVISQYQGTLQFSGDKKKGSVIIVLPRVQKLGEERPNRIMIVDEQDMDRMIAKGVIDHLWPDSVILSTDNPFEFLDNYEDFRPDLVIIDPDLTETGWSNHRVLASLVQNRRHLCPILAVSSLYKDFAERTIAVERGVADFLEKPYSIFDLRFKVKSLLSSHRKEETLHHTMDQAQRQAYTDGLTKLANRKHFDEFLETQIEYSRQTGKPCSMILLDVDNFKHYNDTNGHQFGDEVLKGIGRVLRDSVRASDLAARYGGEEFTIVLPETRKEMAAVVAEKVRRTICERKFPNMEKQPLGYVSASFGVATFEDDAKSGEELIKASDDALYLSKERGRNCVTVANQPVRAADPESEPSAQRAAGHG